MDLLVEMNFNNVIFLSGDWYIFEFFKIDWLGIEGGLYEFILSGLIYSYFEFFGELNEYRVGEVVFEWSFGVILIDWSVVILKLSF